MRAPVDTIAAPPFPGNLPWVNVAPLRMDKQVGRPVLVEFWDFCRPNSLRTLPYLKAWHERYAAAGLRVISRPHARVRARARRGGRARRGRAAGDRAPGLHRLGRLVWTLYDNEGWPSRYLFNQASRLHDFHFGEGGYEETERAIQELLGIEREPLAPLRPEDDPEALIVVPTADVAGPWSGPYVAGAVWAVLDGRGRCARTATTIAVEHPGATSCVEHPVSTEGVLDLEVGDGVECLAVCFAPGPRARRRIALAFSACSARRTRRRGGARRAAARRRPRARSRRPASTGRRRPASGEGAVEDPGAGVHQPPAARQRPVRRLVARPAGRRGGCGRRGRARIEAQGGDHGRHRPQAGVAAARGRRGRRGAGRPRRG